MATVSALAKKKTTKKKTSKKKNTKKKAAPKKKLTRAQQIKAKNPIARWGLHEAWKVTSQQIHLFDDITMSREWEKYTKKVKVKGKKGKKDTTKSKTKYRQSPVSFTFRFSVHKEFFPKIDIAKYIRKWNRLVGKVAPFYLGTTAFGINRHYRLVGVQISDVQQVRGTIVCCTIELSFESVKKKGILSEKKQRKKAIALKKKKAKKKQRKKGSKKQGK